MISETKKWADLIDAAQTRTTGQIDSATYGYVTDGGTYMLATAPKWSDHGRARDLVAILPSPLDSASRVIQLWPTVNPDLVAALRAALDAPSHV